MLRAYLYTVLTAVLVVLSFAPWDFHPLIWVALVPWLFAIEQTPSAKSRLKLGVLFSFLMTVGGFYWVIYSVSNFGGIPYFFAAMLCSIFFVFGQPQFFLLSPLYGWALDRRKNAVWLALLLASIYASLDVVAPRLFLDGMGYALVSNPLASQWAEFGGVHLLSFLVLLVNGLFYQGFRADNKSARAKFVGSGVVTLLLIHGVGLSRLNSIESALKHSTKPKLNFAVIQANIGDAQKLASERGYTEATDQVVGTYLYMSGLATQQSPTPDAIVWPETAYPLTWGKSFASHDREREHKITELVQKSKIPLLFGGYDNDGQHDYNSLFFLEASGLKSVYHKTILLPFAEYVPGFEHWDWFRKQFPQMGFFGRGPGPIVVETKTKDGILKSGPLICYEGLLPSFTRAQKKQGANLLLNVTNDSWFGAYGEPYLHLALTRLRSIETRLPLLRSTNTGITTLVDPTGAMASPTALGTALVANYTLSLEELPETLYVKYGEFWLIPLSLLTLYLLLYIRSKPRH